MTRTYVVVGYSADLLTDLDSLVPPGSVTLVEEADVIAGRQVRERAGTVRCLGEVLAAPMQDEANAGRLVSLVSRPAGVLAVIPANDYGVIAAATLAEAWTLPGAGVAAARVFRDKALLRQVAGVAGIPQPAWREVRDPGQLDAFRAAGDGTCVLKPTNRQASVGVQILGPDVDADGAWALTAGASEGTFRPGNASNAGYLAERVLRGPEMSAEVLVADHRIVFFNATAKNVLPGRHPVEMGHTVPALEDAGVGSLLEAGMQALVDATDFSAGVLHGEWILIEGVPHLVECAARLPGDYIVELISMAYDWSLLKGFLAVLSGEKIDDVRTPVRGAAIRYLSAPPGRVAEVRGAQEAARLDGVRDVLVRVIAGDTVEPITSSWQRPGHVIATGKDASRAASAAEAALARITLETAPPEASM
jgi:biotin carboxylase